MERNNSETTTRPFVHSVELKGKKGITQSVNGLIDDSAMVSSICSTVFSALRKSLGTLAPSPKMLRMADGTRVPSQGQWLGDISLGGRTVKESFEVFPSGGSWSLLVGKPILRKFKAVHDYGDDTLKIPLNGTWNTLTNECKRPPTVENPSRDGANIVKGEVISPSRQVQSSIVDNAVHIDKQAKLESFIDADPNVLLALKERKSLKHRPGRQARDKRRRDTQKQPSRLQEWWNSVWTVHDTDKNSEELGDLQPEVEIGSDHLLFT
jgi:hypothetical protein